MSTFEVLNYWYLSCETIWYDIKNSKTYSHWYFYNLRELTFIPNNFSNRMVRTVYKLFINFCAANAQLDAYFDIGKITFREIRYTSSLA